MPSPFNQNRDSYDFRLRLNFAQAESAFDEWWADHGCVLSQRISVALGDDTPQSAMRRIFIDGFLMGFGEREGTNPGLPDHPPDITT